MAITIGDVLPVQVGLTEMRDGKPEPLTLGDIVLGRRVVLFAVPGAFTPTCNVQLPGYVDKAKAITAKAIDEIVCLSVNDAYVMDAWGHEAGAIGRVRMVADGNGDLARALGLSIDLSQFGLGVRSQRYALIARDGRVEHLFVETTPGLDVSSADSVLAAL